MQNLDELYAMILDRKNNPKKGSYTDYLFTKGLDKILKKVGEESTEVVVAAKNPDKPRGDGELVYESADLLYHLCVLWVEQGVTFDQIKQELAKREGLMSDFKDRPQIKDL
jgi:phosphoribosyl-ATP pyrophosphohydrolase